MREDSVDRFIERLRRIDKCRSELFVASGSRPLPAQQLSEFMRVLAIAVCTAIGYSLPQDLLVSNDKRKDFREQIPQLIGIVRGNPAQEYELIVGGGQKSPLRRALAHI